MNGTCTRCGGADLPLQPIFHVSAHGWWTPLAPEPRYESVCSDCITDAELAYMLHPVVEFVLGVMRKDNHFPDAGAALALVHTFFMSRSNSPTNRPAALRAVGLVADK